MRPAQHTIGAGINRSGVYWAQVVCVVGSLACGTADRGCIENAEVWSSPPEGRFCVSGDLTITGRELEELDFLASLESVTGSLLVYDNPSLRELPAFPALTDLGGSLAISNNPQLEKAMGLQALETVGGAIYVGENPRLVEFQISQRVTVARSLFFTLNPRLEQVGGAYERVDGDFTIIENDSLSLLHFPAMVEIAGNLRIQDNAALKTTEFPKLNQISGEWRITENHALSSLGGFPAVAHAEAVRILRNDGMIEVSLTGPLTTSSLVIEENKVLERIEAVETVAFDPAASVLIESNPALRSIAGFTGVTTVEDLWIEENNSLDEIPAFSGLTQVNGDLRITRNSSLTGPSGWFPLLENVSNLWIFGNTSLPPARVADLLSHVTVEDTARVGDNEGEDTALIPCPWPKDGVCDGLSLSMTSTELCAEDPEDCFD